MVVVAEIPGLAWDDLPAAAGTSHASKRHPLRPALPDSEGRSGTSVIDERTEALMRVAATVAVDASLASFQHAVAVALAAGATRDEIVASLEAVTPVTGAARVVQCAPKVALALGYDVDAALERRDP